MGEDDGVREQVERREDLAADTQLVRLREISRALRMNRSKK
jgi:hypothetical protein